MLKKKLVGGAEGKKLASALKIKMARGTSPRKFSADVPLTLITPI